MIEKTKNQFVFVLGREQKLAQKELEAVLARFGVCFSASACHRRDWDFYRITGNTAFANIENFSDSDAVKLIDALGGTIKIYRLVDSLQANIPDQLSKLIYEEKKDSKNKFNFGISNYNPNLRGQQINSFAIEAKKSLKGKLSLRYVESRDSAELSSILTLKNNLLGRGLEIAIFDDSIGVLVALNDPEEWNKRDYGKPASDKFSGMLPPKLARAMVNLAMNQIVYGTSDVVSGNQDSITVIDPFCGSGSVLMEAMMLGCDVIGSDISEKAVADSNANLKWLTSGNMAPGMRYMEGSKIRHTKHDIPKYEVFQSDATSPELIKSLDTGYDIPNTHNRLAIVTEPYLGRPKKFKQTYASAEREYLKIKELYINFLKNLTGIQHPKYDIPICLAFPLVETMEGEKFSLFKNSVDEIRKLGYTQACEPFIYGRDYQVVKREIVILRLQK